MHFVNLTPHAVNIYQADGTVTEIPTSGTIARITETAYPAGQIDGIDLTEVALGALDGVPAPTKDTIYIVSMPLLMAAAAMGLDRSDLAYPYGQVRDGQGRIIGCRSLARLS
jgi:hypothetical protein